MHKSKIVPLALVVLGAIAVSACFSPWKGENGIITLHFSGDPAAGRSAWYPLGDVTYTVELSSGETIYVPRGSTSIQKEVSPGSVRITVKAMLDGELYAQGSVTITVIGGQNNPVSVPMILVGPVVTNPDDKGDGSLRDVLTRAEKDDVISIKLPPGSVIALESSLIIDKSVTIEGNGVVLTRKADWNDNQNDRELIIIQNGMVKISRIHFKNEYEAPLISNINSQGLLTLESCIFSDTWLYYISNEQNCDLIINGCTFYWESGAAIENFGTVNLTGNLFYMKSDDYGAAVDKETGTVTSGGYNVTKHLEDNVDMPNAWEGEIPITDLPMSPKTFRLLYESGAVGIITNLPEEYPRTDFYGRLIPATNAAAGAVQDRVRRFEPNYFYLGLDCIPVEGGSISVEPALRDEDGLVPIRDFALTAVQNDGWIFPGSYSCQPREAVLEEDNGSLIIKISTHTWIGVTFFLDESGNGSGNVILDGPWGDKAGKILVSIDETEFAEPSTLITIHKPNPTAPGGPESFTAQYDGYLGYKEIEWYVMDFPVSGSRGKNEIIIDAADYNIGTYPLFAKVIINGTPYSTAPISFTVTEQ